MRISLLHPFRVDMTIIEIVDKANYLFFLKENAREREREKKRERALTVLAKALTVLCLDKKKPVESLETIEMITITYHTVKLQ